MRLNNPGAAYNGETNGPNAEIVDHLLGGTQAASSRRLARSSSVSVSSLDYKAKGRKSENLATTKPGKRKAPPQQVNEQQQQQQHLRRVVPTRARGSSGPPPRKYDLSDLDTMDEEQIIKAIYDDPELAAAAAAKAAEQKKRPPTGPPTGARKSRDRQNRASSGRSKEFSEYPDHLREMMDGGVPVTQWIILVALLGVGLYHLIKLLQGPTKKKAALTSIGSSKGRGTERGVRVSKHKKAKRKSDKIRREEGSTKKAEEKPAVLPKQAPVLVPPPSSKKEASQTKKQATGKKTTTKRKKKSKSGSNSQKKAEKQQQQQQQQQPDLVSTDGSSEARQEDGESDKSAMLNIPIHTEPDDDGIGWQTVSKSRTASSATAKHNPSGNGVAVKHEGTVLDPAAAKHDDNSLDVTASETAEDEVKIEAAKEPAPVEEAIPELITESNDSSLANMEDPPQKEVVNMPDENKPDAAPTPVAEGTKDKTENDVVANGTEKPKEKEEEQPKEVVANAEATTEKDKALPVQSTDQQEPAKEPAKTTSAPVEEPPKHTTKESTANDAELARMLQNEEEVLARTEQADVVAHEEEWAEVTKRKKRPAKQMHVQAAA